jgi:hypothetical protein
VRPWAHGMALTTEQRAELEKHGPETVRIKLLQGGADRGAAIPGFTTGPYRTLTRSDVEDWLVEKQAEAAKNQRQTLQWAIIAGLAAIAGVCGRHSGYSRELLARQINQHGRSWKSAGEQNRFARHRRAALIIITAVTVSIRESRIAVLLKAARGPRPRGAHHAMACRFF